ncbi:MAG: nucleotidyltransferase domain-containing protein [Candidatus Methanoperedens sp.]|nr:nucleotidyltransferase domain-containing protein [Candidatus Methanoperedens sp.]MCZ7398060.1 nucleotidyltransferase domain-containing protein [Candidatus Methanoperedens sp.]
MKLKELNRMTESDKIYRKSLEQIKSMILETFRDDDIRIMLFGSRARGDYNRRSDIDIGILPGKKYNYKKLIFLKEKLENINIPYKVDIVDISKVSEIFRKKALKEGEIWKN